MLALAVTEEARPDARSPLDAPMRERDELGKRLADLEKKKNEGEEPAD